jgi:hypothetical protein
LSAAGGDGGGVVGGVVGIAPTYRK